MKQKICNIIKVIILIISYSCCALYAMAIQSTKSWENFLPNLGVEMGIIGITIGLIVIVNKISQK